MNLKKLVIHNLASLQDATIAFDEAPLQGEAIFLITGPTGAGKSMLLDAICLALYNEVPRLHGVAETGVNYTERFNAARGKEPAAKEEQTRSISLNDPRQLMRRGTAECYVRLSFVLDDGEYQAEWTLRRAHGRRDGNMGSVKWTLTDPTGQVIDKNVKETIVQRVGLTFDQFCRTVMLAQGEFTKFIQSRTEEKSAILQKITGTEIYEKVGRRIGERYNSIKNEVEKLQALLGAVTLFTSEEVAQRQAELKDLTEAAIVLRQQQEEKEMWLKWQERAAALEKQYIEAGEALQQAEAAVKSESYLQQQRDIKDYDQTAEARNRHIALQRQEKQLATLLPMEAHLHEEFRSLEAARLYEEGRVTALLRRSKELEAALQALEPHRAMLDEAQGLHEKLKQLRTAEQEIASQQQERARLQGKLPMFEEAVAKAQQAVDEAKTALVKQEEQVQAKQEERDVLQPKATLQQVQELNARKETLAKYCKVLQDIENKQEKVAEVRKELQKKQAEEKQCLDAAPLLQKQEQEAKTAFDIANVAYEAVSDGMKDAFRVARQKLHRGDNCPLCGGIVEKDFITDEEIAQLLQPKKEAVKQCQEAYAKAHAAVLTNETSLETAQSAIANLKKELDKQQSACEEQQARLPKGWTYFWPNEPMPPIDAVAPFLARAEQEERDMSELQGQLEERQQQINVLQGQLDELGKKKEEYRTLREAKEAALTQCLGDKKLHERTLQQCGEYMAKAETEEAELLKELAQKISYPAWQRLWQENAAQLMQQLNGDADNRKRLQEDLQKVATDIATRQNMLSNLLLLRERLIAQCPAWLEGVETPAMAPINNLLQQWQQLCSDYSLWAQKVADMRQAIAEQQEMQAAFFADGSIDEARLAYLVALPEAHVQQWRDKHRQQEAQLAAAKGSRETLKTQCDEHVRQRPTAEMPMPDALREQIATLKEQYDAKQIEIGTRQQELVADGERRTQQLDLQKEKARLDTEKARWDVLYRLLGDTDGKKFRNVAQSFILRHLLDKANRYLRRFTDRYELTCEPGNLVILVQDRLTNLPPQYVKVLSGGESFMVSLSLALALSQLNPHTSSVNILFIDEGFGTLDEESLHAVMETLSRLHAMGGRKVGVISHVEELETLIPTKIKVHRQGTTHSTVTIVTE